jgi:hypothetical protein
VEMFLESEIQRVLQANNQQFAKTLELNLALLRTCRVRGTKVAFAEFGLRIPSHSEVPANFVQRCVAALTGTPELKSAFYEELRILLAHQPALQPVIEVVQKALFGAPLDSLGDELALEQAEIWKLIVKDTTQGNLP